MTGWLCADIISCSLSSKTAESSCKRGASSSRGRSALRDKTRPDQNRTDHRTDHRTDQNRRSRQGVERGGGRSGGCNQCFDARLRSEVWHVGFLSRAAVHPTSQTSHHPHTASPPRYPNTSPLLPNNPLPKLHCCMHAAVSTSFGPVQCAHVMLNCSATSKCTPTLTGCPPSSNAQVCVGRDTAPSIMMTSLPSI